MKPNFTDVETLKLPHYGQIGAGNVVEFKPRRHGSVQVTKSVSKLKALGMADVCGDSLKDMGIDDGDELLCRTKFEQSEITNGKLVIALLPIGLVIKFFYKFEDKIVLRSANSIYQDLIYDVDLVEIKAIVLKSIKSWD